MERTEIAHIVAAVLLMFLVSATAFILSGNTEGVVYVLLFSAIVVIVPVVVKNAVAYSFDSSVTHELWNVSRFGVKPRQRFRTSQPFGIYVPLIISAFSLGAWKVMTFLTYETRALKHRAAKRFGFYSYTAMTDWHNGLIGASGIAVLLLIGILAYLPGWEYLAKMATYYAFWNMVPISKLDGTQIFFGSRILWTVLGVVVLIFMAYALFLP